MAEHEAVPYPSPLASTDKILGHAAKVDAFLAGERLFPATLELDITTECGEGCSHCASAGRPAARRLPLEVVERLLDSLAGETRGLLLSGGEPTVSPDFPAVLRAARAAGFVDVVVVSNGSRLDDGAVAAALLADASAVRVSLYGWDAPGGALDGALLRRIESLRARADAAGSRLEIGVSALTSRERVGRLADVARRARDAGAHWIYFHPYCTGWRAGRVVQAEQSGVLPAIEAIRRSETDGFGILHFPDRYDDRPLDFDAYHACHFLVVVGADGVNYLSTELKYQPAFAIAELTDEWDGAALFEPARLARIASVGTSDYPAVAARHRGVLYSDLLTRLLGSREPRAAKLLRGADTAKFAFPHIL